MASYSYCFKCSVLLREKDFEKGKAFKIGENVACAACAAGLMPAPAPEKPAPAASTRVRSTSVRVKPAEAPAPGPSTSSTRKWALIFGGGGLGVALLVALIFAFMGRSRPPAREVAVKEELPPALPGAPKESPREASALDALEAVRRAAKEKPEDLSGQARAYEELAWTWEGTKASEEARKELAAVRRKVRELAESSLAAFDAEHADALGREEFGAVLARLEESVRKIDAPEWVAGLTGRRTEIVARARGLLAEVVKKAVDHKLKGETAELDALAARVEAWKMPLLIASFKEELDGIPMPAAKAPAPPPASVEKPRSAEGLAWLNAWRAAAAMATARDYDRAAAELKKAAAELNEDDVRKEAAEDVEDFRALGGLYRTMLEAAAGLPVGKPRTVELHGGRRISGVVARVGRDRAELRGAKGPEFAEWGEVTAASLARLGKGGEPRLLALMTLLDGDVEGAKAYGAPLPAKALAYAADAKVPPAPREEGHARELFYAAEREFLSMEKRGLAVEKYATLKNELAATALVRGELERILRRSGACKEYLITAADAGFGGTFRKTADGAAVSNKDSDDREAVDNFFEAEFYALPETPYRAWLLLGGCCREVLSYYLQGTEMTASARGKKVPIEPESQQAEYVASSLYSVKKAHKDHAKKDEPKAAARWDWVPLPLPKYATPGLKKIRLMTNQQGFGVRYVLVSSLRSSIPKPDDLEDLLKAREGDVDAVLPDPDLVLHWSFDEASGEFEDATGRFAGTPAGGTSRIPGKLGGALRLDGATGHVQTPDAPELRMPGDLTIAFWMKKEAEVKDWARLAGKGTGEKRNYGVWEEPGAGKRILWQIYKEKGGPLISHHSTRTVEVGRWHHVACVRRGNVGIIYIDGRKDSQAACDGTPATMADPFTAGHGLGAGHAYFHGALDDLRLYRRALSDEEIQALFDLGQ